MILEVAPAAGGGHEVREAFHASVVISCRVGERGAAGTCGYTAMAIRSAARVMPV